MSFVVRRRRSFREMFIGAGTAPDAGTAAAWDRLAEGLGRSAIICVGHSQAGGSGVAGSALAMAAAAAPLRGGAAALSRPGRRDRRAQWPASSRRRRRRRCFRRRWPPTAIRAAGDDLNLFGQNAR